MVKCARSARQESSILSAGLRIGSVVAKSPRMAIRGLEETSGEGEHVTRGQLRGARQLPVSPSQKPPITPSLLTAHHPPRIPTDGSALPGPCFGAFQAALHGIDFGHGIDFNSMIIVMLIRWE